MPVTRLCERGAGVRRLLRSPGEQASSATAASELVLVTANTHVALTCQALGWYLVPAAAPGEVWRPGRASPPQLRVWLKRMRVWQELDLSEHFISDVNIRAPF